MSDQRTFSYQDGCLHCDGVPLSRVAEEVGTPCYVYSAQQITANYGRLHSAFRRLPHRLFYAVKANSNLSILRLLQESGSGFDIVSGGELFRLRKLGVDPDSILFSGAGKSVPELEYALEQKIHSINVESLQELDLLAGLARSRGGTRISIRLNPDVDVRTHPYIATGLSQHKFGIDTSKTDLLMAKIRSSPGIELTGLACHIGSQILDVDPYLHAFSKLHELAEVFRGQGFPIQHLDLGGGFGIPHRGEEGPDLEAYARFLGEHHGDYALYFEPGRFIVGTAGLLLCEVLYTKTNQEKRFVVVDGAMNDFLRPTLYQAYHEILPLVDQPPSIEADIVGPICESGDFFARSRKLPDFRRGDYLAVMDAGAYGFVFASNYNSRPRAAEVLVEGSSFRVVRRRETYQELLGSES